LEKPVRLPQFVKSVLLLIGLIVTLLESGHLHAYEVKEGDLKTIFYAKTDVPVVLALYAQQRGLDSRHAGARTVGSDVQPGHAVD
jgi:hypothetical protein